jgi:PKHD-type hydroxylase
MWLLRDPNERVEVPTWLAGSALNDIECKRVIDYCLSLEMKEGKVDLQQYNYGEDPSVRKSTIAWIKPSDDSSWLFRRCADFIVDINRRYNYDLTFIEDLQFSIYSGDTKAFYSQHVDAPVQSVGDYARKLSFSIQLNSPSEYEGGDLKMYHSRTPDVIPKEKGLICFFPSTSLHEVTPVTSGTRYALVGWVQGPRFR